MFSVMWKSKIKQKLLILNNQTKFWPMYSMVGCSLLLNSSLPIGDDGCVCRCDHPTRVCCTFAKTRARQHTPEEPRRSIKIASIRQLISWHGDRSLTFVRVRSRFLRTKTHGSGFRHKGCVYPRQHRTVLTQSFINVTIKFFNMIVSQIVHQQRRGSCSLGWARMCLFDAVGVGGVERGDVVRGAVTILPTTTYLKRETQK